MAFYFRDAGSITLGREVPNFTCNTTFGRLKLHELWGDGWGILISHPSAFSPVCATELGTLVSLVPEFTKRSVKCVILSCDPVDSLDSWIKDIQAYKNLAAEDFPFPIIDDEFREVAIKLDMLDPNERDNLNLPLPGRGVIIVGPDKKLKFSLLYPGTTGRNFDEILRVIDSLQLTADKKVITPANWKVGEECMVSPSVMEHEAANLFPEHVVKFVPSGKPYMRITPQP